MVGPTISLNTVQRYHPPVCSGAGLARKSGIRYRRAHSGRWETSKSGSIPLLGADAALVCILKWITCTDSTNLLNNRTSEMLAHCFIGLCRSSNVRSRWHERSSAGPVTDCSVAPHTSSRPPLEIVPYRLSGVPHVTQIAYHHPTEKQEIAGRNRSHNEQPYGHRAEPSRGHN